MNVSKTFADIVSVIVPLYNGKKYICNILGMINCNIEYLRKKECPLSVEVIFVNDSPWENIDENEISRGNEKEENNNINKSIKLICNKNNVGIHQSRIAGYHASSGNLLVYLDQDDEIEPTYLYSQYENLQGGIAVICNGIKEGRRGSKIIYKDRWKASLINNQIIYMLAANQIVSPGQCMIRKKAIPNEWLDNPMHKNGSDDLFLWLLLLVGGGKLLYNPDLLYRHINVGDNPSYDLKKMCESDKEMCQILRKTKAVPENLIQMRERLIEYIRKAGYQSRGNLTLNFRYPDVAILKLFAYYI